MLRFVQPTLKNRQMPTVKNIDGLRVMVRTNDHPPPHVHVLGPGKEAVFELNCPDGPVTLRDNLGFSRKELQGIADDLSSCVPVLCGKWGEFHGNH